MKTCCLLSAMLISLFILACGEDEIGDLVNGGNQSDNTDSQLPPGFDQFADNVEVSIDGDFIVVQSDGVPNHSSPYFGQGNSGYIAPHEGMFVNPNRIEEQDFVLRIPRNPTVNNTITDTNLGAIGVAINGVALFNQYAGRTMTGEWLPLDNEIQSFDIYNGHPQQQGAYHYHLEPLFLTRADRSALIGWSLDGFPVYGPLNPDGSAPQLDELNGEFGATPEYPDGIYHYHATDADPYLIGGYRGAPGTIAR